LLIYLYSAQSVSEFTQDMHSRCGSGRMMNCRSVKVSSDLQALCVLFRGLCVCVCVCVCGRAICCNLFCGLQ